MYLIPKTYVDNILGQNLNEKDKREIQMAVERTVEEYGEVLKMLGKE